MIVGSLQSVAGPAGVGKPGAAKIVTKRPMPWFRAYREPGDAWQALPFVARAIAGELMRHTDADFRLRVSPSRHSSHASMGAEAQWFEGLAQAVRHIGQIDSSNERRMLRKHLRTLVDAGVIVRQPDGSAKLCTPDAAMNEAANAQRRAPKPKPVERVEAAMYRPTGQPVGRPPKRERVRGQHSTQPTPIARLMPGTTGQRKRGGSVERKKDSDTVSERPAPEWAQTYSEGAEGIIAMLTRRGGSEAARAQAVHPLRANPPKSLNRNPRQLRDNYINPTLQDQCPGIASDVPEAAEASPPWQAEPPPTLQPAESSPDVSAPERAPVSLADIEIFPPEEKEPPPEASRWPADAPPEPIDTMEAARECHAMWSRMARSGAKAPHMTPDQERKLVGALRRFSVPQVKRALLWGSLSTWHRDTGNDTIETLLYSPAKVESNAAQAAERLDGHIAHLRSMAAALRQEAEALATIAAQAPDTPRKVERMQARATTLERTAAELEAFKPAPESNDMREAC